MFIFSSKTLSKESIFLSTVFNMFEKVNKLLDCIFVLLIKLLILSSNSLKQIFSNIEEDSLLSSIDVVLLLLLLISKLKFFFKMLDLIFSYKLLDILLIKLLITIDNFSLPICFSFILSFLLLLLLYSSLLLLI